VRGDLRQRLKGGGKDELLAAGRIRPATSLSFGREQKELLDESPKKGVIAGRPGDAASEGQVKKMEHRRNKKIEKQTGRRGKCSREKKN